MKSFQLRDQKTGIIFDATNNESALVAWLKRNTVYSCKYDRLETVQHGAVIDILNEYDEIITRQITRKYFICL